MRMLSFWILSSDSDTKAIIEAMHKRKIDKDPILQSIYAKFRREFPPNITLQDFVRFTSANPSITSPLMMLQLHIRRQILGEAFWERLTKQRSANEEQSELDYIKRLQASVMRHNAAFAKRQQAEEAERIRLARLGRGAEGDCRDNIQRKESRLLSFFGMKRDRSMPRPSSRATQVVPLGGSSKTGKTTPEATHKYTPELSEEKPAASPAVPTKRKKQTLIAALPSNAFAPGGGGGGGGEGEDMAPMGMPEYNPNVHMQTRGSVVQKSSGKGPSHRATMAAPTPGAAGETAATGAGEEAAQGSERRERKRKPTTNRPRRSSFKPDLLV